MARTLTNRTSGEVYEIPDWMPEFLGLENSGKPLEQVLGEAEELQSVELPKEWDREDICEADRDTLRAFSYFLSLGIPVPKPTV
jgi:hypothetical protein